MFGKIKDMLGKKDDQKGGVNPPPPSSPSPTNPMGATPPQGQPMGGNPNLNVNPIPGNPGASMGASPSVPSTPLGGMNGSNNKPPMGQTGAPSNAVGNNASVSKDQLIGELKPQRPTIQNSMPPSSPPMAGGIGKSGMKPPLSPIQPISKPVANTVSSSPAPLKANDNLPGGGMPDAKTPPQFSTPPKPAGGNGVPKSGLGQTPSSGANLSQNKSTSPIMNNNPIPPLQDNAVDKGNLKTSGSLYKDILNDKKEDPKPGNSATSLNSMSPKVPSSSAPSSSAPSPSAISPVKAPVIPPVSDKKTDPLVTPGPDSKKEESPKGSTPLNKEDIFKTPAPVKPVKPLDRAPLTPQTNTTKPPQPRPTAGDNNKFSRLFQIQEKKEYAERLAIKHKPQEEQDKVLDRVKSLAEKEIKIPATIISEAAGSGIKTVEEMKSKIPNYDRRVKEEMNKLIDNYVQVRDAVGE